MGGLVAFAVVGLVVDKLADKLKKVVGGFEALYVLTISVVGCMEGLEEGRLEGEKDGCWVGGLVIFRGNWMK